MGSKIKLILIKTDSRMEIVFKKIQAYLEHINIDILTKT